MAGYGGRLKNFIILIRKLCMSKSLFSTHGSLARTDWWKMRALCVLAYIAYHISVLIIFCAVSSFDFLYWVIQLTLLWFGLFCLFLKICCLDIQRGNDFLLPGLAIIFRCFIFLMFGVVIFIAIFDQGYYVGMGVLFSMIVYLLVSGLLLSLFPTGTRNRVNIKMP